ncbi:hypothetical protein HOH87_04845 [bacterium]|jgi:hypothetical protein|nr:hypothetical protein [bacterium]
MKRFLMIGLVALALFPVAGHALFENRISMVTGVPNGAGFMYERSVFLNTRANVYFGSLNGTMPGYDTSVELSNFGLGLRLDLIGGLFAGVGYSSSTIKANGTLTETVGSNSIGTNVDGTFEQNGLLFEVGYIIAVGPISGGVTAGWIPGQISESYEINGTSVDSSTVSAIDIPKDGMPSLTAFVGVAF